MTILIADSGSTKTDWCLATEKAGAARRTLRTQGINPFHQDSSQIAAILSDELLPQLAGIEPDAIYFYGSGCRQELQPQMRHLLGKALPTASVVEAEGDLLGAARALCGREEGIACILGTGANSGLYDGKAIVANTPPLGYILGDEGSGAVLGARFLNALYRGRLPIELREELEQQTGLTMATMLDRVYRQPLANRFLASLSPFIHAHLQMAEVSDLVKEAFRAFFRLNLKPYGRSDLSVGAVGSIAYHYRGLLSEAASAEGLYLGKVLKSPLEGLADYYAH